MKKPGVKFVLLSMMLFTIAQLGCATVSGGGKQNIALSSTPSGTTVSSTKAGMATEMTYTTPATIAFERKGNYILTFQKEGYDSQKIELIKSMRGWMLFWDIFWFPAGVAVDAITGAWYRLEPDQVNVTLTKLSSAIPGPSQINITLSQPSGGNGLSIISDIPVSMSLNKSR